MTTTAAARARIRVIRASANGYGPNQGYLAQYFDTTARVWFDIGDPVPTERDAKQKADRYQEEQRRATVEEVTLPVVVDGRLYTLRVKNPGRLVCGHSHEHEEDHPDGTPGEPRHHHHSAQCERLSAELDPILPKYPTETMDTRPDVYYDSHDGARLEIAADDYLGPPAERLPAGWRWVGDELQRAGEHGTMHARLGDDDDPAPDGWWWVAYDKAGTKIDAGDTFGWQAAVAAAEAAYEQAVREGREGAPMLS